MAADDWVNVGAMVSAELLVFFMYRKISDIRRTEAQNLNVSRLGLHLSSCNILKPGVKSRTKM